MRAADGDLHIEFRSAVVAENVSCLFCVSRLDWTGSDMNGG